MKKTNRVLAVLLAVAMLLSMAACGSKSNSADSDAPGESAPVSMEEIAQKNDSNAEGKDVLSSLEASQDDTYRKVVLAQTLTGGWDLSPFGVDGGRMTIVMPLYGRLALMPKFGATFDELVGDIGKSFKLSEDGKTCEIEMYDYVHDNRGNKITAKDVEECYNYALTLSGRNDFTRIQATIESVTATGDYSLVIKAKTAGPTVFPNILVGVPIVNWEWFQGASEEERINNPAVTGAYYIAENVGDSYVVYKKVEDYWQEDYSLRTFTNYQTFDEIKYVTLSEAAIRAAALENGEIDLAPISADNLDLFLNEDGSAKEGYAVHAWPGAGIYAFNLNCDPEHGIFANNQALREAVCYALDPYEIMLGFGYDDITAQVSHDFASPVCGDYIEEWLDTPWCERNVELAKQKLEEAGYKPGELTLRFMVLNAPERISGASVIQSQLDEIGIKCDIFTVDNALWSTYKTDFTMWDIDFDGYSSTGLLTDCWNRLDNGDRCGIKDEKLQNLYLAALSDNSTENLWAFHDYLKEVKCTYPLFTSEVIWISQDGIVDVPHGRAGAPEPAGFTVTRDYESVEK